MEILNDAQLEASVGGIEGAMLGVNVPFKVIALIGILDGAVSIDVDRRLVLVATKRV